MVILNHIVNSKYLCCLIAVFGISIPTFVNSKDLFEQQESEIELPDFTRTYGFDIRPDVSMLKKNAKPKSKRAKLKAFKGKLKKRFQKTGGKSNSIRYGVQRYTKYTGSRRYGIGIRRKLDDKKKDSFAVHEHGISYDRQKEDTKYYIGIDSRSPIDKKDAEESAYMFFGIKTSW